MDNPEGRQRRKEYRDAIRVGVLLRRGFANPDLLGDPTGKLDDLDVAILKLAGRVVPKKPAQVFLYAYDKDLTWDEIRHEVEVRFDVDHDVPTIQRYARRAKERIIEAAEDSLELDDIEIEFALISQEAREESIADMALIWASEAYRQGDISTAFDFANTVADPFPRTEDARKLSDKCLFETIDPDLDMEAPRNIWSLIDRWWPFGLPECDLAYTNDTFYVEELLNEIIEKVNERVGNLHSEDLLRNLGVSRRTETKHKLSHIGFNSQIPKERVVGHENMFSFALEVMVMSAILYDTERNMIIDADRRGRLLRISLSKISAPKVDGYCPNPIHSHLRKLDFRTTQRRDIRPYQLALARQFIDFHGGRIFVHAPVSATPIQQLAEGSQLSSLVPIEKERVLTILLPRDICGP